jgi:predicted dehydrogenase
LKKLNTAILGAGKMGKIRYDAMKKHGGYNILAACDINPDVQQNYDCPFYSDWKDCIDKTQPDTVIVSAINSVIPDIVCYALEKGIDVFSEKPPGRNLSDAVRMKNASEKAKKILKFGFNHRYHNSVIEAKALLDSGLLGNAVCARGVYGKAGSLTFAEEWRNNPALSGGGILLDQGIHMLDLLTYFLGDFETISGSVDKLAWHDIQTEDSAFAILKTHENNIASLHSSAVQWKHKFDLDIVCEKGFIALNGLLTSTKSYGEERMTYYRKDLELISGKLGNPNEHTLCFDTDDSWDLEMSEFYLSVADGKEVKNGTPDDAVKVMALIERIYDLKESE